MKILSIVGLIVLVFCSYDSYAVICRSKLGFIHGDIDFAKEGGSQQEWTDYYTKVEQTLFNNFSKNGEPAAFKLESMPARMHESPVQFHVNVRPLSSSSYSHYNERAYSERMLPKLLADYDKELRIQNFMYNRLGIEPRTIEIPKNAPKCQRVRRKFFDIVSRLGSFNFSEDHLQVVQDLVRMERHFLYYGEKRNAERMLYYIDPKTIGTFLSSAKTDDVAVYMQAAGLSIDFLRYLADPRVYNVENDRLKQQFTHLYAQEVLKALPAVTNVAQFFKIVPHYLRSLPQIQTKLTELIEPLPINHSIFNNSYALDFPAVRRRAKEIRHFESRLQIRLYKFKKHSSSACTSVQQKLIKKLDGIFRIARELADDHIKLVKNVTHIALSLIGQHRVDTARRFIKCLDPDLIQEFFIGTATELFSASATNVGSAAVHKLFVKSMHRLAPLLPHLKYVNVVATKLALPLQIGMALYGIYQDKEMLMEDLRVLSEAIQTGNARTIGRAFTRLSIDATTTMLGLGSMLKHAHETGMFKEVTQSVVQGFVCAEEDRIFRQNSQNLIMEVQHMPQYAALKEQILKGKISPQALERRVHDICHMVDRPEDVFKLLERIEAVSKIQGTIIPKGLKWPLKFIHDHVYRLEFDKFGKPDGFHFDEGGFIQSIGKLKFEYIEKEVNGMYRAIVWAGNKKKTCSFFCNQQNDSVKIMEKVRDVLESIDYTKYIEKDKIPIKTPFEGGYLIAHVNRHTSEVPTWYSAHDNWTTFLERVAYEKNRANN